MYILCRNKYNSKSYLKYYYIKNTNHIISQNEMILTGRSRPWNGETDFEGVRVAFTDGSLFTSSRFAACTIIIESKRIKSTRFSL